MSLRDEILEQPAAAERQLASSRPALDGLVSRLRDAAGRPGRDRRPRARRTTPRSTPSTCSAPSTGCRSRSPRRRSCRSTGSCHGSPGRSSSGSASRERRRTSSGSSPRRASRAPRRWRSRTTRARRSRPAADHVIELAAGTGAGDRGDEDLHDVTAGRSPGCRSRSARTRAASGDARGGPGGHPAGARDRARDRARSPTEPRVRADRCVVLGRGFEYATAREWALKLKELAQVFADPYSAADFQHGPVALIEPGVPVLAVAPEGRASAELVELLGRLRREVAADVFVLSDSPRDPGASAPASAAAAGGRARVAPADRVDRAGPALRLPPHPGARDSTRRRRATSPR